MHCKPSNLQEERRRNPVSIKEVHHPRGVTHGSGRSRGVGAALWEKSRRRASRVPGRDGQTLVPTGDTRCRERQRHFLTTSWFPTFLPSPDRPQSRASSSPRNSSPLTMDAEHKERAMTSTQVSKKFLVEVYTIILHVK